MVMKMVMEKNSPELTMIGWDLLEYVKGRKKGVIAIAGAAVASYLGISDNELINLVLGIAFEGAISIVEYYFKKVRL